MNPALTDSVWALDLAPNLKLVLLALAYSADDAGLCQPSLADLYLQQTGYSVNQLDRLLRRLLEMGRIVAMPGPNSLRLHWCLVLDDLSALPGWQGGAA